MIQLSLSAKGGAIVIKNTSDYESEIETAMTLCSVKSQLIPNSLNIVHVKLKYWFEQVELAKNEYEFMMIDLPVIPVIYTLPKVHKS